MRTIWILTLVLTSLTALSQNHLLGFKGGVLLSNSSPDYLDKSYKTSFSYGLTYDFQLKRTFVFSAEIVYSQYGFNTETALFTTEPLTVFSSNFYNYVTFPLKAGVRLRSKLSGYFNIGIVPSILISAKSISDYKNYELTVNLSKSVKNFDLPVIVEIGTDYKVNETILLFAAFSYQHSFTNFTEPITLPPSDSQINTLVTDPQLRHFGFLTSIGLKFRIREKH